MHSSTWRIVVMVTSLCWFAANAKGNLVANGNFEGGTYTTSVNGPTETLPNFWNLAPTFTASLSDVNVVAASTFPGYADPGGGSYYVAFQSTSALSDGQDCLYQYIPTTVGATYTISFYAAMTANAVSNTFFSMEWDASGTNDTNGFIFNSSSGPATNGFTKYTFIETASLSNTLFYFHGTDASGAILVDDLVITQNEDTPEPASLLLMSLGLATVALSHLTKRRCGFHECSHSVPDNNGDESKGLASGGVPDIRG
jgi:hypothetical protein